MFLCDQAEFNLFFFLASLSNWRRETCDRGSNKFDIVTSKSLCVIDYDKGNSELHSTSIPHLCSKFLTNFKLQTNWRYIFQVNNWFINARRRILQPMLEHASDNNQNSGMSIWCMRLNIVIGNKSSYHHSIKLVKNHHNNRHHRSDFGQTVHHHQLLIQLWSIRILRILVWTWIVPSRIDCQHINWLKLILAPTRVMTV